MEGEREGEKEEVRETEREREKERLRKPAKDTQHQYLVSIGTGTHIHTTSSVVHPRYKTLWKKGTFKTVLFNLNKLTHSRGSPPTS